MYIFMKYIIIIVDLCYFESAFVIVINEQRVGNAFFVQLLGLIREPKLHKVTIMCQNLHKPVFIGYKSLPKAS